tara:strand:+ start:60 stop:266 length:207 start_codon:yes stop_codon:yes gene_type:complete
MDNLKSKTTIDDNIMFDGKYYRYVNHDAKLLTTGFGIKNGLLRNKDIIMFNDRTVLSMRNRYDSFYGA